MVVGSRVGRERRAGAPRGLRGARGNGCCWCCCCRSTFARASSRGVRRVPGPGPRARAARLARGGGRGSGRGSGSASGARGACYRVVGRRGRRRRRRRTSTPPGRTRARCGARDRRARPDPRPARSRRPRRGPGRDRGTGRGTRPRGGCRARRPPPPRDPARTRSHRRRPSPPRTPPRCFERAGRKEARGRGAIARAAATSRRARPRDACDGPYRPRRGDAREGRDGGENARPARARVCRSLPAASAGSPVVVTLSAARERSRARGRPAGFAERVDSDSDGHVSTLEVTRISQTRRGAHSERIESSLRENPIRQRRARVSGMPARWGELERVRYTHGA